MGTEKEDVGSFLAKNAGGIIGGIGTIGGWLGIGEERQDRRQVKQDKALGEQALDRNKRAADYEQMLKMRMWEETNYAAQMKQAELGGVSKAAAIGGSGTGTQGASVSAVGGTGAADAASTQNARTATLQQNMQLASQMNLMKAQADNLNADTEQKKASTGQALATTEGTTIANKVAKETIPDAIKGIMAKAEQEMQKVGQETTKTEVGRKTQDAEIKRITAEATGAVLDNILTQRKTTLTSQQTENLKQAIAQTWRALALEGRKITHAELTDGTRMRLQERGLILAENKEAQDAAETAINQIIAGGGKGAIINNQ